MAKKKPDAAKKANRAGRAVTLWLSVEAFTALEQWRNSQPVAPIRTDIIEQALVEFLARQGVHTEYPDAD